MSQHSQGERAERLVALLGPTNTGKTHRAVERMLEHDSGMIGLPLRLLAREVYDRISTRVGEKAVALVTGEEKRVPPRPAWWVCTVEAMPMDREVDFLAVDEIQLAGHRERGHVFTDRLLNARGRRETWFLGADTMRPLVQELVPAASVGRHPRLSTLSHAGDRRLGALPRRSAIVAFSMTRVYELAERIRARRGGAAVVLGALSPRARNAQVALYQAGEVDYLVATDAIGMGLNLDIDHVAFAETTKFDGREQRPLSPAELAQVAGRAGRYLNDGTFGALAPQAELPPRVAAAIEDHRLAPLRQLMWRSPELAFGSTGELIASLRRSPRSPRLRLARRADDAEALERLAVDSEVLARTRGQDRVKLLWEVCQIPDYRQLLLEDHVGLLKQIFLQLTGPAGRLDADWMRKRIARLDVSEGGVEDLLMRMAFIRTWTYVTHRTAWLSEASHWQELTRAIEDRLSDALHQRLMERFIERRVSVVPDADGAGRGGGLRDDNPFAVLAGLRSSLEARHAGVGLKELIDAPFERFKVDAGGRIWYGELELARLTRGPDLLRPELQLHDDNVPDKAARLQLQRRLTAWARDLAAEVVGPLRQDGDALSGAARGLVYLLECGLGTTSVRAAREQLRGLVDADRERLGRLGVRLGRRHVYLASALKPAVVAHRVALCSAWWGSKTADLLPPASAVSVPADGAHEAATWEAIGFPLAGPRAVRADVLERVSDQLWREARRGPFVPGHNLGRLLSCKQSDVAAVVKALGYRPLDGGRFTRPPRRRRA